MRQAMLVCLLTALIPFGLNAQIAQTPTETNTPPVGTRDPQALNILNQTLNAAGGIAAIQTVKDYTATGSITIGTGNDHDLQGSVTIMGGKRRQIRADVTLPTGILSWGLNNGLPVSKLPNGTVSKPLTGHVPSSNFRAYRAQQFPNSLAFPYLQLALIVSNTAYTISYKGTVLQNGSSAYVVQAQPTFLNSGKTPNPIQLAMTVTFTIDASTYQLLTVQDFGERNTLHQLSYSGYMATNGFLVPMSIAEQFGGQPTWSVQLTRIAFNACLADSAFVIQ